MAQELVLLPVCRRLFGLPLEFKELADDAGIDLEGLAELEELLIETLGKGEKRLPSVFQPGAHRGDAPV